ncbi:MAG: hypothetical protein FWD57_06080, partial [Polyangiaceae bacterium]|nr:hypothetical protein [Polyangiaceae bacterium]
MPLQHPTIRHSHLCDGSSPTLSGYTIQNKPDTLSPKPLLPILVGIGIGNRSGCGGLLWGRSVGVEP